MPLRFSVQENYNVIYQVNIDCSCVQTTYYFRLLPLFSAYSPLSFSYHFPRGSKQKNRQKLYFTYQAKKIVFEKKFSFKHDF